jgi:hypothetical protein
MARGRDAVHEAIRRWQDARLIDAPLAEALRTEVSGHETGAGRRWSQYILAATGALVTIIAAGVFLGWAWPELAASGRTVVLTVVGGGLIVLGLSMERRERWIPVAYLLQTAGLAVLLITAIYSREAWGDGSPGGAVAGALGLAAPIVLAAGTTATGRRNVVMPAVEAAFGYAFLFVFLQRAADLDADVTIWILDAVLILALALFAWRMRAAANSGLDASWELNAFAASLYAGMVLVLATAVGPLDLEDGAAFAVDFWLALIVALTLWGIHRAPPGLQRAWYDRQLAVCLLVAAGLMFWTTLGALDASELVAALAVATLGAIALNYALSRDAREPVIAACIVLIIAAWYFGTTQGGALGAVLALAFSAGLLFWLAARLGRTRAVRPL